MEGQRAGDGLAQFLAWLEASGLGHVMRESGVWTYGIANLFHILGIATLFGSILVLDLRLLGVWARVPLAAIAAPTVPIAAVGFSIAVISGTCLIATNATEYIGNTFLLIKFPALGVGVLNAIVLGRVTAWRERESRDPTAHERRKLAAFGGVSLASWLTVISAGRMIGYW